MERPDSGLFQLLELFADHVAGEGNVAAFALDAILALLAEDESDELINLGSTGWPGVRFR